MAGRPAWKVSRALKRAIEALQKGYTRQAACAIAGVSTFTFYDRLKTDQTFADAVIEAETHGKAVSEEVILRAHSDKDIAVASQNARWRLERLYRQEFGPTLDLRSLPL